MDNTSITNLSLITVTDLVAIRSDTKIPKPLVYVILKVINIINCFLIAFIYIEILFLINLHPIQHQELN